jgi:hypothetical protein
MDFLYSLFFAAGVSAFAYTRMGRRIGYGNTSSVWVSVGVIFILVLIVFFTFLKFVLNV